MAEEILYGGESTESVVRIDDTVHRSIGPHSEYVHKLLKLLEKKNYPYSPRYLGMDKQGREVLTYLKGNIGDKNNFSDEILKKIVLMLKQFHNATSGSELSLAGEVVCHRDCAPWNIILLDNEPIGFIDFDDAGPGLRINDLAYFLWTSLKFTSEITIKSQIERIKYLCNVYGYFNGKELVNTIIIEQRKVLSYKKTMAENSVNEKTKNSFTKAYKIIEQEINWFENNRSLIENEFRV